MATPRSRENPKPGFRGAALPKWFVVQLSLDDHTVRETYLMDDPNFTAKDGCCRRH